MESEKPYYELSGSFPLVEGKQWREPTFCNFDSLEDAIAYGDNNCDEYVIYMKIKLEEKLK